MKSELEQYVSETKSKIAETILQRLKSAETPNEVKAIIHGAMIAASYIEPHVDQPDFPIEGTPVFAWLETISQMDHEFEMIEMLKAAL